MFYKRSHFTVIEMLFAIAIIAILSAILMPHFNESRDRARYVRWLHFNKQCSTDPKCVINLNFQEGEGVLIEGVDLLAVEAQHAQAFAPEHQRLAGQAA